MGTNISIAFEVKFGLHYCKIFIVEVVQGLFVPFACVGSGDPVRVLRLFHNEYTGYNWSIYCWDYVQPVATESTVLLY